ALAANSAAAAAQAAGAARAEAAAAKAAAAEADAQAARATRAANTAQLLANTAAQAARTARDAANSAATHADNAAKAADEAADAAGQAADYAAKATAWAAESVKAAEAAAKAVQDAQAVEQAARDSEAEKLAEETEQSLAEARELARAEAEDREAARNAATQADALDAETKDLIAKAEAAYDSGDTAQAVLLGRRAAMNLISTTIGTWSRSAAEYALAGADEDVLAWVSTDRGIAQTQDDRETVLALAKVSTEAVADAAQAALSAENPGAVGDFLTSGIQEAAATDNRVAILRILAGDPGKAVKAAAQAALDDGSPQALHDFFLGYAEKVVEDDQVAILSLLDTAGPYTKAAAQVALEGPSWMRRDFVTTVHHRTAQLDYDWSSHVAAVRASIAHAAKIAQEAQKDAYEASKAAAEAREAADEAAQWAAKAQASADKAADYAVEADANADAAERSAQDAQASADKAKAAAASARSAARRANYSANQAVASAAAATQSAVQAQASANAARQSAYEAGKDAAAAARAASEARTIAAEKRQQELAAAARAAAEAARQNQQNGVDPSDTSDNDKVDNPGGWGSKDDWRNVAQALNAISAVSGTVAAFSLLVPPPAGEIISGVAGTISWVTGIGSAVITLCTDGWQSEAFLQSVAGLAVGALTGGFALGKIKLPGVSQALEWGAQGLKSSAVIASRIGHELVGPAIGFATTSWNAVGDVASDIGGAISDGWNAIF
ncbi:ALF repeat-containing protein, partial [Streptomyces thermodiastaticus]|nr:ALF repeat-containing protein [Streptomyces thermodiastaticus]